MLWTRALVLGSIVAAAHAAPNEVVKKAANPTATIDVGQVIGTTTVLPSATVTVNKFLGIPFAVSPPVRFAPPVAVGKFAKPVVAQAWSPGCIQQLNYPAVTRNFSALLGDGSTDPAESEDCLYLNVYTPATATPSSGLSVMYWIYGGSLQLGLSGQPLYDGSSFATNQNVIVVTVNYRVNIFGFSNSPELPLTSQNVGFLDQRLGLDWVQRNIKAFGGDPAKVTIFGESAGGESVERLVTSPPKPAAFRGAISESGVGFTAALGPNPGPANWKTVSAAVGCNTTSDELACMRAVDPLKIKNVLETNSLEFPPVTDGVTQIPLPADRASHQTVPILYGNNGQEARIFSLGQNNLTAYVQGVFPGNATFQAQLIKAYAIGTPGVTSDYDGIAQILTDFGFQCPVAYVCNGSALAGFPTWRYYYNATIPNIQPDLSAFGPTIAATNLEAFHGSEMALVFGTYPTAGATAQEIALSKFIQTAWATFAKNPMTGPGWASYGSKTGVNPIGVGDLGANGGTGVTLIKEASIDSRCYLYQSFYNAPNTY